LTDLPSSGHTSSNASEPESALPGYLDAARRIIAATGIEYAALELAERMAGIWTSDHDAVWSRLNLVAIADEPELRNSVLGRITCAGVLSWRW